MAVTCFSTVVTPMPSWAAICALLAPVIRSAAISRSRAESFADPLEALERNLVVVTTER
jgi:hypothetical protein